MTPPMTPIEANGIEANGILLYYEQNGAGENCLIINGSGTDLRYRPNVMDTPLSNIFKVTSYDQRGLGQSEKPDTTYTMADYADDAAAFIEALSLGPALILGISFGGMVGQELAIRHPRCVKKLSLFCTSPGGDGGASYPIHELATLPPEERTRKSIMLNDNRITDAWISAHPDKYKALQARANRNDYDHEPNYTKGIERQLAARAKHDCWDRLSQIACPVLLGGGLFDDIATPTSMQNMASRIPNASLKLYQGGHLFMTQDPNALSDVANFFKTQ